MRYFYICVLTVLFVISCSDKKTGEEMSESEMKDAMAKGKPLTIADFKLVVPPAWVEEPPASDMRLVQYYVKNENDLKIIGFYFGNQPDMVNANIDRWKQEFTNVDDYEKMSLANDKITLVTITGTFKKKPFPMAQEFTEQKDYMTIASIVPSNEGPYFFKLVGEESKVRKQLKNFNFFMNSYKHIH